MKTRVFLPLIISLAFGGIVAFLVLYLSGYSDFSAPVEYRVLADAMTLPAVLLMGAGVLILASRSGVFDVFSYAFSRLVGILAPFMRHSDERFYDFKSRKSRMDFAKGAAPLLVGTLFLISALMFLFLFYFR